MNDSADDRSPMAKAMGLAARGTTIALTMVAFPLGGLLLDYLAGTTPVFVLVGCGLGLAAGLWQLIALAKSAASDNKRDTPRKDHSGE